ESCFDVTNVQSGFSNRETNFRERRLRLRLATIRFEEDRSRNLLMKTSLANRLDRFFVEAKGVGVLFAAYVCRYCALEFCATQLFEDCRSKHRIIKRSRSHSDERVLVSPFEACLISVCDPECEETQNTAGLLKSRQGLPLALKDRQKRRMKRISGSEGVFRMIHRKPCRDLGSVCL